jgi:capsular polysaccharide biosynthesis protein
MYLQQVLASLRRRWMLTGAAIILAASVGYATLSVVGPVYTSQSSLVLVPPPATSRTLNADGTETEGNPYMYLGGLTEARDVLVKAMSSEAVHDQVSADVSNGTYEVTPDFETRAPMLLITTEAPDRATAGQVTQAVLDQVPTVLTQIQEDLAIPKDAQITTRLVTADPVQVNHRPQLRMVMLAVVGVLSVMALLIGVLDGLLLRRQRRASARDGDDGAPEDMPDAESEAGLAPADPPPPAHDDEEPSVDEQDEEEEEEDDDEHTDDDDGESSSGPVAGRPRGYNQRSNGKGRPRKQSGRQGRSPKPTPLPGVAVKGTGGAPRNGATRAAS